MPWCGSGSRRRPPAAVLRPGRVLCGLSGQPTSCRPGPWRPWSAWPLLWQAPAANAAGLPAAGPAGYGRLLRHQLDRRASAEAGLHAPRRRRQLVRLHLHPQRPRMESYWKSPQGIDRGEPSRCRYALNALVGHHGIFSLTPIWLLSICGALLWLRRDAGPPLGRLALAVAGVTLVCLTFYLAAPGVDRNYGGTTSGFRWVFWMAPLWLLLMLPCADAASRRRSGPGRGLGPAGPLGPLGQLSHLEPVDAPLAHGLHELPGLAVGVASGEWRENVNLPVALTKFGAGLPTPPHKFGGSPDPAAARPKVSGTRETFKAAVWLGRRPATTWDISTSSRPSPLATTRPVPAVAAGRRWPRPLR